MKLSTSSMARLIKVASISLALGAAFAAPVAGETRAARAATVVVYASASNAQVGTFNWHAKRAGDSAGQSAATTRHLQAWRNLGNGSYICSPAGSGRRAACFQR